MEYQSIQEAGTCIVHDLAHLPARREPGGSMCVFEIKHNADGSVERYKARIVVQDYSQIQGLDDNATFTLLTRYDSLRLMLALGTHLGLDIEQVNIKSAF